MERAKRESIFRLAGNGRRRWQGGGVLEDGAEFPLSCGLRVIRTVGHGPGHICRHFPAHRLPIAGDAVIAWDAHLLGPHAAGQTGHRAGDGIPGAAADRRRAHPLLPRGLVDPDTGARLRLPADEAQGA